MRPFRIPFDAMASACEVVVAAPDEASARSFASVAIAEVQRIESTYSRYRRDSVVSRINSAAGQDWVECDAETLSLLDFADHLYRISGGSFDITSGVLRQVWNFKVPVVPGADELARELRLVDWRAVQRDGSRVRLSRPGMELDFGGFGKEYAADRAADALAAAGVRHGYVNLAGDIRVVGERVDGAPWSFAIQHPRQRGELIATLPLSAGGLATSGDYERYFEIEAQRYCHILQSRTGMPVRYWRSVSVIAPLAIVAGGIATVAMLLEDAALDFLRDADVHFLAVDQSGTIFRNGESPTRTS